jgi:hypothetical protein
MNRALSLSRLAVLARKFQVGDDADPPHLLSLFYLSELRSANKDQIVYLSEAFLHSVFSARLHSHGKWHPRRMLVQKI